MSFYSDEESRLDYMRVVQKNMDRWVIADEHRVLTLVGFAITPWHYEQPGKQVVLVGAHWSRAKEYTREILKELERLRDYYTGCLKTVLYAHAADGSRGQKILTMLGFLEHSPGDIWDPEGQVWVRRYMKGGWPWEVA